MSRRSVASGVDAAATAAAAAAATKSALKVGDALGVCPRATACFVAGSAARACGASGSTTCCACRGSCAVVEGCAVSSCAAAAACGASCNDTGAVIAQARGAIVGADGSGGRECGAYAGGSVNANDERLVARGGNGVRRGKGEGAKLVGTLEGGIKRYLCTGNADAADSGGRCALRISDEVAVGEVAKVEFAAGCAGWGEGTLDALSSGVPEAGAMDGVEVLS